MVGNITRSYVILFAFLMGSIPMVYPQVSSDGPSFEVKPLSGINTDSGYKMLVQVKVVNGSDNFYFYYLIDLDLEGQLVSQTLFYQNYTRLFVRGMYMYPTGELFLMYTEYLDESFSESRSFVTIIGDRRSLIMPINTILPSNQERIHLLVYEYVNPRLVTWDAGTARTHEIKADGTIAENHFETDDPLHIGMNNQDYLVMTSAFRSQPIEVNIIVQFFNLNSTYDYSINYSFYDANPLILKATKSGFFILGNSIMINTGDGINQQYEFLLWQNYNLTQFWFKKYFDHDSPRDAIETSMGILAIGPDYLQFIHFNGTELDPIDLPESTVGQLFGFISGHNSALLMLYRNNHALLAKYDSFGRFEWEYDYYIEPEIPVESTPTGSGTSTTKSRIMFPSIMVYILVISLILHKMKIIRRNQYHYNSHR